MNQATHWAALSVCVLVAMAAQATGADTDLATTTRGTFDPESTSYRSVVRQGVTLSVKQATPNLVIEAKDGARAFSVALRSEAAQLRSVHVSATRIIAIAWANGALASVATIVDRANGQVLDSFFGYGMAVSPDARYIAFRKAYPRMVESVSEQYMLYDAHATPTANRPARPIPPGEAGTDRAVDVGLALYPVKPGEAGVEAAELSPELRHRTMSDLECDAAARNLAFVDVQASKPRLVHVRMPSSGEQPVVRELSLEGALCDAPSPLPCASLVPDFVSVRHLPQGVRVSARKSARTPDVSTRDVRWAQMQVVR